jgi:NTP pyrophosphatase (non-canonical NTP hydrolase)
MNNERKCAMFCMYCGERIMTVCKECIPEPSGLTFNHLKMVNEHRARISFPQCEKWGLGDWGCALAGEVGEACNKIKKLRRGETISNEDIADELADAVIYADLICTQLGVTLGEAVARKFNEVSDRVGYQGAGL